MRRLADIEKYDDLEIRVRLYDTNLELMLKDICGIALVSRVDKPVLLRPIKERNLLLDSQALDRAINVRNHVTHRGRPPEAHLRMAADVYARELRNLKTYCSPEIRKAIDFDLAALRHEEDELRRRERLVETLSRQLTLVAWQYSVLGKTHIVTHDDLAGFCNSKDLITSALDRDSPEATSAWQCCVKGSLKFGYLNWANPMTTATVLSWIIVSNTVNPYDAATYRATEFVHGGKIDLASDRVNDILNLFVPEAVQMDSVSGFIVPHVHRIEYRDLSGEVKKAIESVRTIAWEGGEDKPRQEWRGMPLPVLLSKLPPQLPSEMILVGDVVRLLRVYDDVVYTLPDGWVFRD